MTLRVGSVWSLLAWIPFCMAQCTSPSQRPFFPGNAILSGKSYPLGMYLAEEWDFSTDCQSPSFSQCLRGIISSCRNLPRRKGRPSEGFYLLFWERVAVYLGRFISKYSEENAFFTDAVWVRQGRSNRPESRQWLNNGPMLFRGVESPARFCKEKTGLHHTSAGVH